jgi:hypothetical protein
MKPNVKMVTLVDGKVFMEMNLTVADMEWVGRVCDEVDEVVSTFFQVGTGDGDRAVVEVEPTFRDDK